MYCTLAAGRRWIEDKHGGVVLSILSTSTITGRAFTVPSAMAKAGGGGLGWAPETFDTSAPGEISLSDLLLDDGYVWALAVVGPPADIALYRVAF